MMLEERSSLSTVLVIIIYIVIGSNTDCAAAYVYSDIVVPSTSLVYNETTCPPWLTLNATGHCTCGSLDSQSKCNYKSLQKLSCSPVNQIITVCDRFLMTWSSKQNVTVISFCSGYPSNEDCEKYTIPRNVVNSTELNAFACENLNRTGPYCQDCIEGYGHAIFSATPKCVECSETQWRWGVLYLLLQLVWMTLFYLVFVISKIKVTSSPLCALVFFWQTVAFVLTHASNFYDIIEYLSPNTAFLETMLVTLYGIWNLDSFRYVVPPVCLSSSLRSLHVLLLDYLIAFYPFLLTLISYIGIELYDRQYRIIVFMWKPFGYCIGFFSRDWKLKESILNTFVSFLILSYSNLLITSLSLVTSVKSYKIVNGTLVGGKDLLYCDPGIESFSADHVPYAILAFIVFFVFIVPPPLLLLFYPNKYFQKCLGVLRIRWHGLQFVVDTFQGWFKDGTNGTRDYRSVSALYFFLRIALASMITATPIVKLQYYEYQNLLFVIPGFMFMIAGHFLLIIRPYKKNWMNISDGLLINLLGLLSLNFAAYFKYTFVISAVLATVPTFVYITYILYNFAKRIKLCAKLSKVFKSFKTCSLHVCCRKVARMQGINESFDPFLIHSYRRKRTLTGSSSGQEADEGDHKEMKENIQNGRISGYDSYGLMS